MSHWRHKCHIRHLSVSLVMQHALLRREWEGGRERERGEGEGGETEGQEKGGWGGGEVVSHWRHKCHVRRLSVSSDVCVREGERDGRGVGEGVGGGRRG